MFEKYLSLSQPAVHLCRAWTRKFTRLGGTPSLPPTVEWPNVDGKELPFLLQVDLAAIHVVLPTFLPSTGAVYFFFDQRRFGGGSLRDAKWWRVLYFPGDPKQIPLRLESKKDRVVYRERQLKPRLIESLPSHYRFPKEFVDEGELTAYVKLSLRPFGRSLEHHQMHGHAGLLQDGYPELECELRSRGIEGFETDDRSILDASLEWRLLCQIDTDEVAGWMWGDSGIIFFWIRESDAKRAAFSRVWMTFQCL